MCSGKFIKIAQIKDEELMEGTLIADLQAFLVQLRAGSLKPDFLTFCGPIHWDIPERHKRENDNFAVIPVSTFEAWWNIQAEPSVRRAVRKAEKSGITVKEAEFNDEFVQGIVDINNETPIRQGRQFWHYQKPFALVRHEHMTYSERNIFLGAYLEGGLVGYLRMTRVNNSAHIIQILSMQKHSDKRIMNALIAKAVEVCEARGLTELRYCNYVYHDPSSSLTEFKKRNGFTMLEMPRYFIPLTLRGQIALACGLHKPLKEQMPLSLRRTLIRMRDRWFQMHQQVFKGNA
jgi:hypothetical protein